MTTLKRNGYSPTNVRVCTQRLLGEFASGPNSSRANIRVHKKRVPEPGKNGGIVYKTYFFGNKVFRNWMIPCPHMILQFGY